MRYKEFEIKVERKNNRNLYLRIKEGNSITVTVPYGVSDEMIMRFIKEKEDWIRKALVKSKEKAAKSYLYKGGDIFYYFGEAKQLKENVDIEKVYKDLNRHLLKKAELYVDKYMPMLRDYHYDQRPVLKARKMTSKWGVCYTKRNTIILSSYLIHYPENCLEYVVLHEMVHFIVPNHSTRFYSLIEKRIPDYKKIKKMMV